MRVPYSYRAVDPDAVHAESHEMPHFQSGTIEIADGGGKSLTEVFAGIRDRVGVDEILLVTRRQRIHLLHLRIGESTPEPMFQGFIRIRLIIVELDLTGIARDQPGSQLVVTAREIEMSEFPTIVHPVEIVMLGRPCGKIAVHRPEIRYGEYIPSFFYVYLYIGLIAAEILQVYDHLIEQMGIYQPIVRHLECDDQPVQADRISCFEGQLPFNDIILCLFIPRYVDLSYHVGLSSIRIDGRRREDRLRGSIETKEQGYYRPGKFQIFR